MTLPLFSEAARRDRREITEHTVARFGMGQAWRMREHFEAVFRLLVDSPGMGRTRPELDPPGHTFRYFVVMRRFIVVYESTEPGLRVARILHGARSLAAELDREPGDET